MELLIADDNPLSLRFLADAAGELGHRCDTAADGAAALALARAHRYDLLLLDVHMPALDGPAVLRCLRDDTAAASRATAALATSADVDAPLRQRLCAAGFADVLAKPIDLDGLRRTLGAASPACVAVASATGDPDAAPLLDDTAACRSLGSSDTVAALRALFRRELDTLADELETCRAAQDAESLRERLHKLCASAGFCGAPRLEQAARRLRSRLATSPVFAAADLAELQDVAAATHAALGAAD
ncbi:response regulator [Tahibacter caeni]|uniref:response regulator n=1 Tax=Tahibacter caeni TaxID=1453545 RepID=UPI002147C3B5|nr:response regulator [Tahibacter caeni]